MPNNIPKIIHLFWSGKSLNDQDSDNVISFLNHLNDEWKLFLWLTDQKCLDQSKYFKSSNTITGSQQLPKQLIIMDTQAFLAHPNIDSSDENQENYKALFATAKLLISRELIGLGNPAAAKDGIVPAILYQYGGYYFDIDAMATNKISAPVNVKYGVATVFSGTAPVALAAEKGHIFCILALESLIEHYQSVPSILKLKQEELLSRESIEHYSPTFFNLQTLRNRKEPLRNIMNCITSGGIIRSAFLKFAKAHGKSPADPQFQSDMNFKMLKADELCMGIKFNFLPAAKAVVSNPLPAPKKQQYFTFLTKIGRLFHRKKTDSDKKTVHVTQKPNWRDDTKYNSFEYEDIKTAQDKGIARPR